MSGAADDLLRWVTRILLGALDGTEFVLAGAGAIRAHGLTDRPTEDIDLFAGPLISESDFAAAVATAERALVGAGLGVQRLRQYPTFARLHVQAPDGLELAVDLAVNWRADPPVRMNQGLVLSERDAVAGKVSAVYSRAEVRDFLDLDAIRASGRYSDDQLLELAHEHDAGFVPAMFAAQLSLIAQINPALAEQYGVSVEAFRGVQTRTLAWADRLTL